MILAIVSFIISIILINFGLILIIYGEKFGYKSVIIILFSLPITVLIIFSLSQTYLKIKNLLRNIKWWYILWALFFISGLTFRLRSAKSAIENPLDKAAFLRVILVSLVGIGILLYFTLNRRLILSRIFSGCIKWLALYSGICIISTFWSFYPARTLYRSCEYFIGVLLIGIIVCLIKKEEDFKHFFDWTIFLYTLLMISVWVGVFLKPNEAIKHLALFGLFDIQIRGVFPKIAANSVGELGALIGIVSFTRLLLYKESKSFYLTAFIISMVTLILAQSRSPLVGFILGVFLILTLARKIRCLVFLSLITGIIVFSSISHLLWEYFLRGQTPELFWSLTNRITLWKKVWPIIRENIFLGYGAYAGGLVLTLKVSAFTTSLHGTWMEVLANVGIIGLILLVISIFKVWLILINSKSTDLMEQLRLECLGIMSLLTFRSIFSVTFIWHPATIWLLVAGFAQFLRINSEKNQK